MQSLPEFYVQFRCQVREHHVSSNILRQMFRVNFVQRVIRRVVQVEIVHAVLHEIYGWHTPGGHWANIRTTARDIAAATDYAKRCDDLANGINSRCPSL